MLLAPCLDKVLVMRSPIFNAPITQFFVRATKIYWPETGLLASLQGALILGVRGGRRQFIHCFARTIYWLGSFFSYIQARVDSVKVTKLVQVVTEGLLVVAGEERRNMKNIHLSNETK